MEITHALIQSPCQIFQLCGVLDVFVSLCILLDDFTPQNIYLFTLNCLPSVCPVHAHKTCLSIAGASRT